mgnify:CR=1 FL=1
MSLSHQIINLAASAVSQVNPVSPVPDYAEGVTVSIQNLHSTNNVYLGNSGTSSVSYGFRLSPGQSISYDLDPSDQLFAICGDTSASIAITRLYWQ